MHSQVILQGTDGIRGRTSHCNPQSFGQNALQYFLGTGFLTPLFFEHYTFAYASLLLESGSAEKGDTIVVGWDPRDDSGEFNRAAVSGILKTGLNVMSVGILPTPAVPLFMMKTEAAGSVVLTASHNPSDQNGIKLFHGWTALKFLPADDIRLSRKIYQQQDMDLSDFPESGIQEDHAAAAKSFFVRYQTDPQNSWITGQTFEDQVVVIDASKGAVAGVIKDIFDQYRFNEVIYTNLKGGINESCGVADLEGQEIIEADQIINENSRFFQYQTLRAIMKTAHDRKDIRSGKVKLSGLVFDGDGDRCYMLDYDPEDDAVIISSGDQLGIHLLRYLKQQHGKTPENRWFINTVESDLKTAITAEEEGFQSIITGVGDKWILKQAVVDLIRTELVSGMPGSEDVKKLLGGEPAGDELSGLDLSKAWKEYRQSLPSEKPEGGYRFLIGIEESGHSITPGFIDSRGGLLRCFAGNGIKSGLNALAAMQQVYRGKSGQERIAWIRQPFAVGIKKTSYTYYVYKEKLQPGSSFRRNLESTAAETLKDSFPGTFSFEQIQFLEETGLVYFRIAENGKTAGAVFVRNSGTEDKSALYLRGESDIADYLEQVDLQLHLFLLKGMKKTEDEFIELEKKLLKAIAQGDSLEHLRQSSSTIPFDRILKEIEFKEGLITKEEGVFRLTKKGKLLNAYWEKQE